jgi:hypothetical protein
MGNSKSDLLKLVKQKLTNWKTILFVLVVTVAMGVGAAYYFSLTPIRYTAKSVFYPDREATMSGSPLELLTAAPGLGSTSKAGALGILSKVFDSRSMTKLVVSHKVEKDGENLLLADLIINDNNKSYKPWQAKDNVAKMSDASRVERAAAIIRGGCFAIVDESGFMSLTTNANNKDLALLVNKIMIQELIKFNFDKKTEKAAMDMRFINHRLDSVSTIYQGVKYSSANYSDANKYMAKATVKIPMEDLEEQRKILQARYTKLVELQEQAFIRLQADKPVIQLLDAPFIDSSTHASTQGAAIIGAFIGMLLSIMYSLRRIIIRFIRAEIAKNKQEEKE